MIWYAIFTFNYKGAQQRRTLREDTALGLLRAHDRLKMRLDIDGCTDIELHLSCRDAISPSTLSRDVQRLYEAPPASTHAFLGAGGAYLVWAAHS